MRYEENVIVTVGDEDVEFTVLFNNDSDYHVKITRVYRGDEEVTKWAVTTYRYAFNSYRRSIIPNTIREAMFGGKLRLTVTKVYVIEDIYDAVYEWVANQEWVEG